MNRIFGKKKPEAPRVNISDVGTKVDGRITDLDLKVRDLNDRSAALETDRLAS
jgi:charged multivesicular body protein 5